MSNFNEFEQASSPKKTHYRKWSFKVFVYTLLTNALVVYMVYQGNYNLLAIIVTSWIANFLLLTGTILTILTIQNKEPKDYQYYTAIIGNSILILLTIISLMGVLN